MPSQTRPSPKGLLMNPEHKTIRLAGIVDLTIIRLAYPLVSKCFTVVKGPTLDNLDTVYLLEPRPAGNVQPLYGYGSPSTLTRPTLV